MADRAALSEFDLAVYESLIASPGLTAEALIHVHKATAAELMAAITRLAELCLVRCDGQHRYQARSPAMAESLALGTEELELGVRRVELEARRSAIQQVGPQWVTALRANGREKVVDTVYGAEGMVNVLMHFAQSAQREVLTVTPGRSPSRLDPRTRIAAFYALQRGVQMRLLYQPAAVHERPMRAYLRELTEYGAQVRVAPSLPGRSIVIDREVALVQIPHADLPSTGLAIVREPTVVTWVVSTFEQLWTDAAAPDGLLGASQSGVELDQTRAAILQLLCEGEKDEAISRRLSISVRTCRRHIADYMAQVGATSRFQAGVIASRDGHLDMGPARE